MTSGGAWLGRLDLARPSKSVEVAQSLLSYLLSGELQPGDRIPSERSLTQLLGVGRGAVREALKSLTLLGLLEVRQGDGTYVKSRSELAGAMRREMRNVTDLEVQEVRRALEVEGARLAAKRRTDADLYAMTAALDERDLAAALAREIGHWDRSWGTPWVEADVRFHQAVVTASHNPLLTEMYLEMGDELASLLYRLAEEESHEPFLVRGHRTLLVAIEARDEQGAALEAMHNVEVTLDRLA